MPRGTLQTIINPSPGGTREDLSPALIPEGWLLSSRNWLTRRGRGKPRPGYDSTLTVTDALRIIGIGFRGTHQQASNIVFFTRAHQYSWDGTSLTNATSSGWVASTDNQLVRSITFTQGGTDYLLATNTSNALLEWTGSGAFTATGGSPPAARDLVAVGNRILLMGIQGTSFPYRVQWSGFKDRTSWTSTGFTELRETSGYVVGGANFGPNTAAVYKDDSIYLATVQAAVEPFQFQYVAMVPGPLSPAAIVNVLGVHYWMGEDFSIYQFDGAEPKLVSSGLVNTVQQNISYADRDQTFGFPQVTQDFREVWFFYPNRSETFNGISCNIITGAVNHHVFADAITAGAEWRMGGRTIDGLDAFSSTIDGLDSVSSTINGLDGTAPIEQLGLLGTNAGEALIFGSAYTDDDGTAIPWAFEHPWTAPGKDQARVQVDAVDTLWYGAAGPGITITAGVAVTDKLTDSETFTTTTFNNSTDEQHLLTFPNMRGKLVKIAHSGNAVSANLEFRGAVLTSWPRGRV